jgi:Na+/phosphate symporter
VYTGSSVATVNVPLVCSWEGILALQAATVLALGAWVAPALDTVASVLSVTSVEAVRIAPRASRIVRMGFPFMAFFHVTVPVSVTLDPFNLLLKPRLVEGSFLGESDEKVTGDLTRRISADKVLRNLY